MPGLFWAFIAATVALMAIPGPNVALITTQSALYGRRAGLAVVGGVTLGQAVQIMLVGLGFAALLQVWSGVFHALRLAGAAYLVFMGIMALLAAFGREAKVNLAPPPGLGHFFRTGMGVALANPKTMLFHAAFFPQFIDPQRPVLPQYIVLGTVFLILAFTLDGLWALGVGALRGVLRHPRIQKLLHGLSGGIYIVAGGLLALRRAP